ncbi:hypothetical protein [Parafilimonas sp.]|uniref:hypothetical protein n=1 Tax=Parafilimonas sp. TaxID=1969739 RepID=UPI0039E5B5B7
MRNKFISQFAELNAMELETSIRAARETVTVEGYTENARPVFTAANLWNIHNKRRMRITGRMFVA